MTTFAASDLPRRVPLRLPGISARAWEHPSDRAALAALRKVPGFGIMVRAVFGLVGERPLRLASLASAVRVGPRQFPRLHVLFSEVCEVLGAETRPELYVAQTPMVNAGAVGVDHPFIVLNSGTLQLMDQLETQFILGHELGHVLSGHALYKTMLRTLLHLGTLLAGQPLAGPALFAVTAALLEWDRCSELSADRAGLLAIQDQTVAQRTIMKLAGGPDPGEMSVEEFELQALEYQAGGSVVDSAIKLMASLAQPHPFPVVRFAELRRWMETGEVGHILGGTYPLRSQDSDRPLVDDVSHAVRSWQEGMASSRDALGEAMAEAVRRAWDLGRRVNDGVRGDRPSEEGA